MAGEDMIKIGEIQLEADPARGNMVILKESKESERYFLMFVGDAEFAAIAKEKGMIEPKRPLTHQLYLRILENVSLEFKRVEIYDLREGTYYANVYIKSNGKEFVIDSRPSDAVALALNRNIPIFVKQGLFRKRLTEEEMKEYESLIKSVKF
ncbi:MAG TPA: bifunctional nuclease family protein [Desulfobacteraceae bacterium]|nr:bifunctional nuclease family protein [Desulfobacteraceae bacterium]